MSNSASNPISAAGSTSGKSTAGNSAGGTSAGGGTYRAPTRSAPSVNQSGDFEYMIETIGESVKDYGSKHPLAVASAIFCVGFYLGWKVKPW